MKKNKTVGPSSIHFINQNQSYYQNGLEHGALIKESIRIQIKKWELGITSYLNIDRDSMSQIVYHHSGFINAIKKYTPELLDEINGIADGAELNRDLLLFYNLGEEIFNYCTANIESCSNIAHKNKAETALAYK